MPVSAHLYGLISIGYYFLHLKKLTSVIRLLYLKRYQSIFVKMYVLYVLSGGSLVKSLLGP